jgi:hypothetical protein
VEDAQKEAESIVSQARAHADRIREESDRELVAATQRRDSINSQLTNVRQMLATLTSAAPAALFAEQADPAAEPAGGDSDLVEIEIGIDGEDEALDEVEGDEADVDEAVVDEAEEAELEFDDEVEADDQDDDQDDDEDEGAARA